jgi:hypothetical protein
MAHALERFFILFLALTIAGCHSSSPKDVENACAIYREFPEWRTIGEDVQRRFGTPPSLQLAIIYTESHFNSTAHPPREYGHVFNESSARGYAQALDGAWRNYLQATHQLGANRENFEDASNFIGWYTSVTKSRLGIPYSNARDHYLAFHEGWGGFSSGSYKNNKRLIRIAQKTQEQALLYHNQLLHCHFD